MAVRFFNGLAWIGFLVALLAFLLAYAGFPDEVLVQTSATGEPITYIGKDTLFYSALAFYMILNMAMVLIPKLQIAKGLHLVLSMSLMHLARLFFNLFFAAAVYFISILNSREDFSYNHFGYIIYVTGGILAAVVLCYPVARYLLKK